MPDKFSNLGQFWQELKRRKVVRVITVYAAATFVILELVSIIKEPLLLPDWTEALVIVLLCIGFIITVIFSWIYDITPEGIEKTKPVHEIIEKLPEKPSGFNAWKIATFISVIIIVGLIIFHTVGERKQDKDIAILDKSIAVLPFKSLSDDPDKQYLADAVMDAILLHLSKIEDLRVMPRTSIEQYRETDKTVTTICQELDIAYLLEGSFQMYGDQVNLIVQLTTPGKEDHIWASEYNRNWKNIFAVQSEVAQTIASELQAVITPEEKQLIEKIPTTSLTAYDFYQKGREEQNKHWLDNNNREALQKAEDFYHEALDYDSTFAQAYTGLAWVYWRKHEWEEFLTDNFMDSSLILVDIALSFDNQLAEAYILRGYYFEQHNDKEQALIEYDKAIKFNPNSWLAFWQKGRLFRWGDVVESLSNFHKAAALRPGPILPELYKAIAFSYAGAGFYERAYNYYTDAFKLDNDAAQYYQGLFLIEDCFGNFEKALELGAKSLSIATYIYTLRILGSSHRLLNQYKESLEVYKEIEKRAQTLGNINIEMDYIKIGYAYLMNGFNEEAQTYLQRGIEYHYKRLELGRHFVQNIGQYYNLTAAYSILGDVDSALYHLEALTQIKGIPLWVPLKIKIDPMFDNIRDEPQFQQMVRVLDSNYQVEHERVRQWLEENDML